MEILDRIRDTWNRFLTGAGEAFRSFMAGRNGMDPLNFALLWGYVGLYVLRVLFGALFRRGLLAWLLSALCGLGTTALFIAFLFRALSRNLPKRREENRRWIVWWQPVQAKLLRARRSGAARIARTRDREHRYFTCKSCGTVCRVPRGKGKIVITCPRCGTRIQAKS